MKTRSNTLFAEPEDAVDLPKIRRTVRAADTYIRLFQIDSPVRFDIITVVGKDTKGIIAKVCTYLADNNVNILDISQTIVQEYFNMMMIVDMTKMEKPFVQASDELTKLGESVGVQVKCQREEIFDVMHRI